MTRESFQSGRYVVRKDIAQGTFSRVVEAMDVERAERVALKILPIATTTATHARIVRAMFDKEVGALSGLGHPALVRLLQHFHDEEAGALVLVLELVEGGRTLQQRLEATERGGSEPALHWRAAQLVRLLEGLSLAHEHNVVHRDIKPANVLMSPQDALVLVDFGVARVLENYGRGSPGATLRDFYTRPYAAPEQLLRQEATAASDIHAFSLLAAAVLGLQLPKEQFEPTKLAGLLARLPSDGCSSERAAEVERVLRAGVDPNPRARPRLQELAACLETVAEGARQRRPVPVVITDSVRASAAKLGFQDVYAVLEDVNADLRVTYEEESERSTIKCYGQFAELALRIDKNDPTRLIAVNVRRPYSAKLRQLRQLARPVPFMLEHGTGSAETLIQDAFDSAQEVAAEADVRRRVRDMFELGRVVLEEERRRTLHLRVRCRARKSRRRGGRGKQTAIALTGQKTLDVIEVAPADGRSRGPDDLPLTWAETLEPHATFERGGRPVASFRGFDVESQRLALTFFEPVEPTNGIVELELHDHGRETALRRQEAALAALEIGRSTNERLRDLLLEPSRNIVGRIGMDQLMQLSLHAEHETLDLVARLLGAEDIFLLQGPPGTGKTTLIVELVAQILCRSPTARVLISSQTHEAVDNALESLEEVAAQLGVGWRMVRDLGQRSGRARGSFDKSFDDWVRRVRSKSEQALAGERGTLGPEQVEDVEAAIALWCDGMERSGDVRQDFAETVQVFAATCLRVPAVLKRVRDRAFDWVIVDEAAKATPTEALVPMVSATKIVLVGDHKQLPPFLDSQTAEALAARGFDADRAQVSLFEELFERMPDSNRATLATQFRMHPSIGGFVGDLFYSEEGGLKAGVDALMRGFDVEPYGGPTRVFWVNVVGRPKPDGTSWWNREEADAIEEFLQQLANSHREAPYKIAVIAPYRAQVDHLRRRRLGGLGIEAICATVDAFQGRQVDVVLYSMVRDIPGKFVSDPRRLNVAFSRARRLLVIFGSARAAMQSGRLRSVYERVPPAGRLDWTARHAK